ARLELDRVEEIVEAGNLLAAGGIPDDELNVVGPDLDRQVVEAVGAGLEIERLVGRSVDDDLDGGRCDQQEFAPEIDRRSERIERAPAFFHRDAADERSPQRAGVLELQVAGAPPSVAVGLVVNGAGRAAVEAVPIIDVLGETAVKFDHDSAIPSCAEQKDVWRD